MNSINELRQAIRKVRVAEQVGASFSAQAVLEILQGAEQGWTTDQAVANERLCELHTLRTTLGVLAEGPGQ